MHFSLLWAHPKEQIVGQNGFVDNKTRWVMCELTHFKPFQIFLMAFKRVSFNGMYSNWIRWSFDAITLMGKRQVNLLMNSQRWTNEPFFSLVRQLCVREFNFRQKKEHHFNSTMSLFNAIHMCYLTCNLSWSIVGFWLHSIPENK